MEFINNNIGGSNRDLLLLKRDTNQEFLSNKFLPFRFEI